MKKKVYGKKVPNMEKRCILLKKKKYMPSATRRHRPAGKRPASRRMSLLNKG